MRGPTSPALASPSKSTVLRYSHSFDVPVSFFEGSACTTQSVCLSHILEAPVQQPLAALSRAFPYSVWSWFQSFPRMQASTERRPSISLLPGRGAAYLRPDRPLVCDSLPWTGCLGAVGDSA